MDWDDAYANAAHIAGAVAYPERWAAEAKAFRAATRRLLAGGGFDPATGAARVGGKT